MNPNPNPTPPADLPSPDPDGWQPDPVLHARRQELLRRVREEGYKATYDDLDGLGADLWASDEEFEEFLKFLRRKQGHGN